MALRSPFTKVLFTPNSFRFLSTHYLSPFTSHVTIGVRLLSTEKKSWSSRFRPRSETRVKERVHVTPKTSESSPVPYGQDMLTKGPDSVTGQEVVIVDDATAEARTRETFRYVGGGVAITAASAVAFWKTGLALSMASMGSWVFIGVPLVTSLVTMIGTMMIDVKKNPIAKHLMWAGFASSMAVNVSLLGGMAGGPVVMEAAMATGGLFGALAYLGTRMKPGSLESWQKPLTFGLFGLIGVSIANIIWPAPILYHLSVYGGITLFGAFTISDVNDILAKVKTEANFDPINESLRLYLDIMNIFIRILELLRDRSSD